MKNEALLNHLGLVDELLCSGKWEEARRAIDECLAEFPGMRRFQKQRLWSAKTQALIALGDREGAMKYLACAGATRSDEKAEVLKSMGARFIHHGLLQEALYCFDTAVCLKPGDPRLHQQRSLVLKRLGREEEARAALSGVTDFEPADDYEEWLLKGDMLYGLNRFNEARKCYEQSMALNPGEAYSIGAYSHAKRRIDECGKHA